MDNVAPPGHNWGFNAFYPNHVQAHPGDTVTFGVARNPGAFHSVELLAPALSPDLGYPGFMFLDEDDDPPPLEAVFFNSKPFFGASPSTLCGKTVGDPCSFPGTSTTALKSGVLVNPPKDGSGTGNTAFTLQIDSKALAGTYFFICLVHGPSMRGSIDVLPADQPAESPEVLRADADRSYQSDILKLADIDHSIRDATMVTQPNGSRSWSIAAGGGGPDRLTVNEFGVRSLFIRAGDSVTWTNESPQLSPIPSPGSGSDGIGGLRARSLSAGLRWPGSGPSWGNGSGRFLSTGFWSVCPRHLERLPSLAA